MRRLSNIVGFDDAPFARAHTGRVDLVGAVFADLRFDGVLIGQIDKDGDDAGDEIVRLVAGSRFAEHVQAVLLQGITFGGFNVVDLAAVHEKLRRPVVVVVRRNPDLDSIRAALCGRVAAGERKWRRIEAAGPMEPVGGVYVQRAGLSLPEAQNLIARLAVHGRIPEPLRVAHLIAGALGRGASRGRA